MAGQSDRQTVLAIAWYRAAEWRDVQAFCDDGERLESSYEEWRDNAAMKVKEIEMKGYQVERVDFSLEEFKRWCKTERKRPDAAARSEFAAHKSADAHKARGEAKGGRK